MLNFKVNNCFLQLEDKIRQKNEKNLKKVLTLEKVYVIIKKYWGTDEKKNKNSFKLVRRLLTFLKKH